MLVSVGEDIVVGEFCGCTILGDIVGGSGVSFLGFFLL